eukprot:1184705-Prorocentrum_minimum.AAC.5
MVLLRVPDPPTRVRLPLAPLHRKQSLASPVEKTSEISPQQISQPKETFRGSEVVANGALFVTVRGARTITRNGYRKRYTGVCRNNIANTKAYRRNISRTTRKTRINPPGDRRYPR